MNISDKELKNFVCNMVKCCRKLLCFIGVHKWVKFCDNFYGENGTIATIGFNHCSECAKSKIIFIYGEKSNKAGE